uniref:Uncharacterized protein n=1 Tax=Trypanosoma vivax (strain Y486) TaxID=1055687 RepID=G0TSK2_TRYVY|nr:hypothetical protein TVY486_0301190 [Trypanosoma vivax Y486]
MTPCGLKQRFSFFVSYSFPPLFFDLPLPAPFTLHFFLFPFVLVCSFFPTPTFFLFSTSTPFLCYLLISVPFRFFACWWRCHTLMKKRLKEIIIIIKEMKLCWVGERK